MVVYLIGSLRNPEIPNIANKIREAGFEVFADWYAAGEKADDAWRDFEKSQGGTYLEALKGYAAKNVFEFDKRHLERADAVILAAPAGKSGHLELGWALGQGKRGYYLLDSPDRWDVMLQFATLVTDKLEDILFDLQRDTLLLGFCVKCGDCMRIGDAITTSHDGIEMHYNCYVEAQG